MTDPPSGVARPVALVTGVDRMAGIGAGIACRLAASGWDIAFTFQGRTFSGAADPAPDALEGVLAAHGAATATVAVDLADPATPARIFDTAERRLGAVTALVMCHGEPDDPAPAAVSGDRHHAVNARASWLLIREYAARFRGTPGAGRIVGDAGDHAAGDPYGAGRGVLGRVTLAAAFELALLGISTNVVDPGPVTSGTPDSLRGIEAGPARDADAVRNAAELVEFLCSPLGEAVNGRLLTGREGLA